MLKRSPADMEAYLKNLVLQISSKICEIQVMLLRNGNRSSRVQIFVVGVCKIQVRCQTGGDTAQSTY